MSTTAKEKLGKESSCDDVMCRLDSLRSEETILSMKRFGINVDHAYGIQVKMLRMLAKEIGKNHVLAFELWRTGVHEARRLATMIDDPKLVTSKQMECWVREFDSWDVCDGCCNNLFVKTPFAYGKAIDWSLQDSLFVKRAGFVLMASLAIHDKAAKKSAFTQFIRIADANADEHRNLVKKAIRWALKEIRRRNLPEQ